MTEMVIPGVYIEVRAEGLMVPGPVTVGNLGVVGTASKGPIGTPVILGSYLEARDRFGDYDAWVDGASDELTLVRALELAYGHGATTVFALRVANHDADGDLTATKATYVLASASGPCVTLTAKTEGTWGNDLSVNVWNAEQDAFVEDEQVDPAVGLTHTRVARSARNRIRLFRASTGITRSLAILYDDDPDPSDDNQVKVNQASGALTFNTGLTLTADDKVTASYVVDQDDAAKVTLRYGRAEEIYTVVDGNDLVADITRLSALVDAAAEANAGELPLLSSDAQTFAMFSGGDNGADASDADYKNGLDLLLNEPAHIIVAAGKDDRFGDELNAHCQSASTDAFKRERIGVVGSALGATLDSIRGHILNSDRLIFAAPGIKATDAASGNEVTLSGAYAAAAVAGLLAGLSAHISPTNKILSVGGLERRYTSAELSQIVQSRVLVLEERQGIRIVKGITTSTNTAWHQITTRRIVDFAKFGVRSAANPFIGLLNNDRVRSALRTSINSFLAEMVQDEKLVSYELEVSATRDEERRGIVRVTMVLRPVFSIDFIKVTMFLE